MKPTAVMRCSAPLDKVDGLLPEPHPHERRHQQNPEVLHRDQPRWPIWTNNSAPVSATRNPSPARTAANCEFSSSTTVTTSEVEVADEDGLGDGSGSGEVDAEGAGEVEAEGDGSTEAHDAACPQSMTATMNRTATHALRTATLLVHRRRLPEHPPHDDPPSTVPPGHSHHELTTAVSAAKLTNHAARTGTNLPARCQKHCHDSHQPFTSSP